MSDEKLNVEVLWDNILVELDKETAERRSPSGLILPNTHGDTIKAKVLKAGPGQYLTNGFLVPMPVTEGQFVGFDKTAGRSVEISGNKYKILRVTEVQFIFTEEENDSEHVEEKEEN